MSIESTILYNKKTTVAIGFLIFSYLGGFWPKKYDAEGSPALYIIYCIPKLLEMCCQKMSEQEKYYRNLQNRNQ